MIDTVIVTSPGRLQQLHLSPAMRRPQMLDLPWPPPGGIHDLNRRCGALTTSSLSERTGTPTAKRPRASAQIRHLTGSNPQVTKPQPAKLPDADKSRVRAARHLSAASHELVD